MKLVIGISILDGRLPIQKEIFLIVGDYEMTTGSPDIWGYGLDDAIKSLSLKKLGEREYALSQVESLGETGFAIRPYHSMFHRYLEMLDSNGKRIGSVKFRNITRHSGCLGYKCNGESTENREQVFELKKHEIGNDTDFRVSLMHATSNDPGFRIIARPDNSCAIYKLDSGMIAETTVMNNQFNIKVFPHVDSVFVALLVATVDTIRGARNYVAEGVMELGETVIETGLGLGSAVLVDQVGGFLSGL